MHAMRILGLAAMMAVTAAPLAVHAEPDQKNNRGYVVGKGGVARSANTPQPDGGEPGATVPKQSQQATFGERAGSGRQQAGSAVASGAALVGATPPGEHCVAGAPSCSDGAKPAKPTTVLKTKHDTVKNSIGNIR